MPRRQQSSGKDKPLQLRGKEQEPFSVVQNLVFEELVRFPKLDTTKNSAEIIHTGIPSDLAEQKAQEMRQRFEYLKQKDIASFSQVEFTPEQQEVLQKADTFILDYFKRKYGLSQSFVDSLSHPYYVKSDSNGGEHAAASGLVCIYIGPITDMTNIILTLAHERRHQISPTTIMRAMESNEDQKYSAIHSTIQSGLKRVETDYKSEKKILTGSGLDNMISIQIQSDIYKELLHDPYFKNKLQGDFNRRKDALEQPEIKKRLQGVILTETYAEPFIEFLSDGTIFLRTFSEGLRAFRRLCIILGDECAKKNSITDISNFQKEQLGRHMLEIGSLTANQTWKNVVLDVFEQKRAQKILTYDDQENGLMEYIQAINETEQQRGIITWH